MELSCSFVEVSASSSSSPFSSPSSSPSSSSPFLLLPPPPSFLLLITLKPCMCAVSTGARLAVELGCSFVEVSASEDVARVMEAFHTLCREIIDFKRRSRTFLDRVFGLKKS